MTPKLARLEFELFTGRQSLIVPGEIMARHLNIPDEYRYTFNRLMNSIPDRQKNNLSIQKAILLYLKLGGEKLAKQYIEIIKLDLRESVGMNKNEIKTSEKINDTNDSTSAPSCPEVDELELPVKP